MIQRQQLSPLARLSDDVFLNICDVVTEKTTANDGKPGRDLQSLKALSQCNRRFRRILAAEIFRSICVFRPESWKRAQGILDSMRQCDDARHCTERFTINLLDRRLDGVELPASFMHDLVGLLAGMAKLKDITLEVMERAREPSLKSALQATDVSFPSVRRLYIDADTHFLISRCPNLESVTSGRSPLGPPSGVRNAHGDLVNACKSAPRLRHLDLRSSWPQGMLEKVLALIPQLTSLGMEGAFGGATLRVSYRLWVSLTV